MQFKQLKLGSLGLTISVDDILAGKIRSNAFYRSLIRPVLHYLEKRGKNGPVRNIKVTEDGHISTAADELAAELTPEQKALREQVATTKWYHSIDLGHGIITPGLFDHRPNLSHYHLPESLRGKRVLDVATYDGFWAFEFEKRGADEVVAMDIETWNEIDIPPRIRAVAPKEKLEAETGIGFRIAKEALGSNVQRGIMNVYNLTPEWKGKFDFVFCSDLLLHLMNPMKALHNIHSVVSEYAYIIDVIYPEFGDDESSPMLRYIGGAGRMVWWHFGLGSLKKMISDAGFSKVEHINTFESSVRDKDKRLCRVILKAYP